MIYGIKKRKLETIKFSGGSFGNAETHYFVKKREYLAVTNEVLDYLETWIKVSRDSRNSAILYDIYLAIKKHARERLEQ